MSIRVTLNCQINPDQLDKLQLFLEENLPNVRGFKGNQRVSVFLDEESHEMLLDEDWLTVESHQSYLKFIEGNGVLAELSNFLSAPPEIKYFKKVAV